MPLVRDQVKDADLSYPDGDGIRTRGRSLESKPKLGCYLSEGSNPEALCEPFDSNDSHCSIL